MTADPDLWVGIDVGTQSVKAVVVDGSGVRRGSGSSPLVSDRTGNHHEQDPGAWLESTATALRTALAPLSKNDKLRIRGIATCATSGSLAVLDEAGTAVSPGLMYDDGRAGDLAEEVQAADPDLWDGLGYRMQPSWALPKVVWLERHGLLGPGRRIAHQADVIAGGITGHRVATDASHALKTGYDTLTTQWPVNAFARLGLDVAAFPHVVDPGDLLGVSSASWSDRTGLPEGVPVSAGMTDGCAAQISAGTLSLGDWHTVVGTTLVVKTVSSELIRDSGGGLYSHRSPMAGQWFPGGASSVGAGALTSLFPDTDPVEATGRVASLFNDDLLRIPVSYPLTSPGERFPVTRPDARGFIGDSLAPLRRTGAQDADDATFAAVLLGVACVERLCVDTLASAGSPVTGRVSTSGGGAKNRWWVQLRADVLGRPIDVPATSEGSIGMAMLAAWAADHTQRLADVARRMSPHRTTIEPGPARGGDAAYGRFLSTLDTEGWLVA